MFNGKYNLLERHKEQNWCSYTTEWFNPLDCPLSQYDILEPYPLQNPYEFSELLKEYIDLQPMVTVEIGSYFGGTLFYWLKNAPLNGTVISVDLKPDNFVFNRQEIWPTWVPENINFKSIEGDSTDFKTRDLLLDYLSNYINLKGKQCVDFLFIDGDHRLEQVTSDFILYGNLVKPGGIIALHDIDNHLAPEVNKLWKKIYQAGYKVRNIANPNPHTFGIGIVYV
jgi:predicted O-methyltransferase YrrM